MASSKAATFIAFRSIVKRSLTTVTTSRSSPRNRLLLSPLFCQTLASTSAVHGRKIPRNHFTSNRSLRQEAVGHAGSAAGAGKTGKRHATRKAATNNSLRKVAVDAQLSRRDLLVRGSGKHRHVGSDVDTKDVTAFCAAETYDLSRARWDLHREGFVADPFGTGLFPQVLHVQTPNFVVRDEDTGHEKAQGAGDVFVFPSGCVVTWNVPERLAHNIVQRFLVAAAAETSHIDRMEVEDLEYVEDPSKETSRIVGDTIILGTRVSSSDAVSVSDSTPAASPPPFSATTTPSSSSTTPSSTTTHSSSIPTPEDASTPPSPEVDTVLAKIAFSSALARSTKLAVLENSLSHYFSTTRAIPTTLSSGKPLRFTRPQILRKTGELLSLRAQLNLYSELTDSLPDLFWDAPHALGLEGYYEMAGRALDVGVRIKVLNERMDYASEIAAVLRERLSEKHSAGLEWMIIGLICIEVAFGVVHLWREGEREGEERRARQMWEAWLARELRKEA